MKNKAMRASLLIALIICLAALSGCHSQSGLPEFEIPAEFDRSAEHEIVFWAKNDTNVNQVKIYEKAISDFEALYPNVKITLRLYTDYSRIYNDVITNISTQTTPNVCITYPDHIATYLTGVNTVVPLDGLIGDAKFGMGGSELEFDSPGADEIVPKYLEECRFDGHYYALPYMRSTEVCYINKTILEKMGFTLPDELTWDFIWEASEAAAEKNADGTFKSNGQTVMIPFIYKSTDNMMIQLAKQSGAGYSNDEGDVLLFNDEVKKMLFELADHVKKGAFSTFKISSYPANYLNAGQCVFAIDSTAGATWMGTTAPLHDISVDKIVDFEIAVRPLPQIDPSHPQMISQGPSVCVFNKQDPQEVLASWLFAQFLLTNGVQIAYSETEGYVPVTTKARESEEYTDYLARAGEDDTTHYSVKIDAAKILLENTENTFVTPVYNGSASLRDAAGQLIENVTKSVRRKETVDEKYMENLFSDVTALYRLDSIARKNAQAGGKEELGELPVESAALIAVLIAAWVLIAAYFIYTKRKNRPKT